MKIEHLIFLCSHDMRVPNLKNKHFLYFYKVSLRTVILIFFMAVLKIYNDIQTENDKKFAKFFGEAEGVCFKDVDEFCESIPADDKNIEVRLHCDGGSCVEGWAIYDRLRATGKDITCTVEGNAASMATVILMAAPKARRRAYKSAQLCVHNPWIPSWALDYTATADDLEKAANDLREQQTKMLDLYVERCECDREEMQALMNEDKYIGVDRAMELGLIGEIIAPASAKKQGAMFNNKNHKQMAKEKNDDKVEIKASLLDRALAKLGLKTIDELAKGMDLSTSDGQTLTVEREEGEPQVGDNASPDGEFVMPDGKTIVVKDGVITDIKTDSNGSEGDSIAELEAEIEELKKQVKELEQAKATAEANAKTKDDLRILNAVKIAGGEKALAKISSSYKPEPRKQEGGNAAAKAGDKGEASPMRQEIEARRKGTFNKK